MTRPNKRFLGDAVTKTAKRNPKRGRAKSLFVPKSRFKTAVGNGSEVLLGVDKRSLVARRFREIQSTLVQDLGGEDAISEAELQLIRSATGLVILRESMDADVANGEKIDLADYTRLIGTLGRTLRLLGLERRAKDITPDPLSYAKRRSRDADDIEEVDDEGPS